MIAKAPVIGDSAVTRDKIFGDNAEMMNTEFINLQPKTNLQYRSFSGYVQNAPEAYSNRTYQIITTSESHFNKVRLVFKNVSELPVEYSGVSLCANTSNTGVPSSTLIPVTLDGSSSIALKPRVSSTIASHTYSDWINVESVSRSDSGTLPLLLTRCFLPSGVMTQYGGTSQPDGGWDDGTGVSNGRVFNIGSSSGDKTQSQTNISSSLSWGCPSVDFEFKTKTQSVNVMAVGDSITNGDSSGGDRVESPVHIACSSISSLDRGVQSRNEGFSSQPTNNFEDKLFGVINSESVPDILVYSSFSPNDVSLVGATDQDRIGAIEAMKPNVISAIAMCRSQGIKIVLSSGLPYVWNTAVDNARKSFNTWVESLTDGIDVFFVDFDSVGSDGETPSRYKPSYSVDTLHPSTLCYQEMGGVLAVVLNSIIKWDIA